MTITLTSVLTIVKKIIDVSIVWLIFYMILKNIKNNVKLSLLFKGVKVNLSKSGISTSVKVGNVTYNTKRGTTVNLGKGVSYHTGNSVKSKSRKSYK